MNTFAVYLMLHWHTPSSSNIWPYIKDTKVGCMTVGARLSLLCVNCVYFDYIIFVIIVGHHCMVMFLHFSPSPSLIIVKGKWRGAKPMACHGPQRDASHSEEYLLYIHTTLKV